MVWSKKSFLSSTSTLLRHFTTTATNGTKNPTVKIKDGKVRGAAIKLYDGSSYYSFKGIPYAKPPVGKLRFKAPERLCPWKEIYDATTHGPICPQIKTSRTKPKEDENCLFLNVYCRSLETYTRLPVMVYIHGGAFLCGSGNSEDYGPEYLILHDVVVVTFNYRVEVFGFLCLDIPEVPGNGGMKDQVAVLRWVQDNITYFGGDPNNVTIFGESSGGSCVTYHMLSPMSDGLFHKAIAQSATCLSYWSQGKDSLDRAYRLGKLFGIDANDPRDLFHFLLTLPAKAFTSNVTLKTSTEDEKHRGFPTRFCPVVEKEFQGVEPFVNEDPLHMILSNKIKKIPTIIGYNSMEGAFFAPHQLKIINFLNENPQYVLPREISEMISVQKMLELAERVKKFYVGDRDYTKNDILNIAQRETEINFALSVHRFAHFYSKFNRSLYMYLFNYDTDLNYIKKRHQLPNLAGAYHGDDLFYIFKTNEVGDVYEQQNHLYKLKGLVYRITKLWTDFAKTGNPTPDDSLEIKWNPYTTVGKEYLHIDENMIMRQHPDRARVEFWDGLYHEVGLPSFRDGVCSR